MVSEFASVTDNAAAGGDLSPAMNSVLLLNPLPHPSCFVSRNGSRGGLSGICSGELGSEEEFPSDATFPVMAEPKIVES